MTDSNKFQKSYTLATRDYEGDPEYWDARQINDVRSSAMQQGFRPTGDPSLAEKTDDGRVTILRFELPVEVAQGADSDQDYEVTHAKVSPADQETFEVALSVGADPDAADARVARENATPDEAAKAVANDDVEGKRDPSLSPQKVEPSSGNSQEVEPAVSPKRSRRRTRKDEDALLDTRGERQTSEKLADEKREVEQ